MEEYLKLNLFVFNMPNVRNFHYRSIKCPLCQKIIETNTNNWFCSKKCEEEWEKLNGELKKNKHENVKGRDTSS